MKMSPKVAAMVKSYGRAVLTAWLVLQAAGVERWQPYAWSLGIAVVAPVVRALDKKDPAFGRLADAIDALADSQIAKTSGGVEGKPLA